MPFARPAVLSRKACWGKPVDDGEGVSVAVVLGVEAWLEESVPVPVSLGDAELVAAPLPLGVALGVSVAEALWDWEGEDSCDSVGVRVCDGLGVGERLWLCDRVKEPDAVCVPLGVRVCDSDTRCDGDCDGLVLPLTLDVALWLGLCVRVCE